MQLHQLQQGQQHVNEVYEQDLPKYEDICPDFEENNKVVQVFVVHPQQHEQQQHQQHQQHPHQQQQQQLQHFHQLNHDHHLLQQNSMSRSLPQIFIPDLRQQLQPSQRQLQHLQQQQPQQHQHQRQQYRDNRLPLVEHTQQEAEDQNASVFLSMT